MSKLRQKLHEIIFEADTPAGKAFDVALLIFILLSILGVILESVDEFRTHYQPVFDSAEWFFTIIFTFEYILRVLIIKKPLKYVFSFFGLVDLLSIIPTYLGLFISGNASSLMVIRTLRLLRIFRILKLARFVKEAQLLGKALSASRAKITVFLGAVLALCVIMGTLMYLIEGSVNHAQFSSIPRSIYWAIVTLTTVGYGDIAPITVLGQTIAAIIMIMGYGVIAVPTGIVTIEFGKASKSDFEITTQSCPSCSKEGHDADAKYCKHCGVHLHEE